MRSRAVRSQGCQGCQACPKQPAAPQVARRAASDGRPGYAGVQTGKQQLAGDALAGGVAPGAGAVADREVHALTQEVAEVGDRAHLDR